MAELSTGRPALACARGPQIVRVWLDRASMGVCSWLDRRTLRGWPALALVAIAQLSHASGARAEPELDLAWSAPAGCPDSAWARQRIAAQLAREPAAEVAEGVRARVTVTARAAGFELQLQTVAAGTSGERTIQAGACEELAQAAVLIIALSVSETSERNAAPHPPEPPSPPAPAPAPNTAAHETLLALRADLIIDYGFFDQAGFGPGLAAAYQYDIWRAELAALWLAPRTIEKDGVSVDASLWAVRAGGCALFGSWRVQGGPCIGGEFGQARGEAVGNDLNGTSPQRPRWIAGFAGGRLSVGLIAKLALVFEADLNVLVAGPSFVVAPADASVENLVIHTPEHAQLRASAGAELRF